eukprot:scaffold101785_cov72-Phaeocystis_antarctica.AAC.3
MPSCPQRTRAAARRPDGTRAPCGAGRRGARTRSRRTARRLARALPPRRLPRGLRHRLRQCWRPGRFGAGAASADGSWASASASSRRTEGGARWKAVRGRA